MISLDYLLASFKEFDIAKFDPKALFINYINFDAELLKVMYFNY